MDVNYKQFISNGRIYLREVRESDVNEKYYFWVNDSDINKYLETRFMPHSHNNLLSFVRSLDGDRENLFFAICLKRDNQHIGNIKLGSISWHHRRADLGYLIGERSCWGKGYATEAIGLAINYAFSVLNLNKIEAGVYAENIGSIKALEKCGFVQEGVLREHVFCSGQKMDSYLFGLCAKDYWKK